MTQRCHAAARGGKEPAAALRRRRLVGAVLFSLLTVALWPIAAPAQQAGDGKQKAHPLRGKLELIFTDDSKAELGEVRELRLRPNVRRQVFLHLRNKTNAAADVQVELTAAGQAVASTSFKAPKNATSPVIFGKAPPEKDGKDGKAAKPPALAPVKSPMTVRLLDAKGKLIEELLIGVAKPKEYVNVDSIFFYPVTQEGGAKNVLEVRLSTKEGFTGSAARVELVLDPGRVPSLKPGQEKAGRYAGVLRPGTPLTLRAENLQFLEGAERKQGLIYLTVDGYRRAFTYVSSFLGEKTKSEPRELTGPIMRLVHPSLSKPGPEYPVIVEVDNEPAAAVATLALYREYKDGKLLDREDVPRRFAGDRQEQMAFNPAGPLGSLLFEPKVADWAIVLDTTDVYGVRWLAGQMLDTIKEAARLKDATAPDPVIPVLNSKEIPEQGETETTRAIVERVVLYDGKPSISLDLDLPEPKPGRLPQLVVGAPLPLRAVARDPSGITKAIFFAGKPPADGKLLPTVPQAEGEQIQADPDVFRAELPAPGPRPSVLLVSVQMTNGIGQKAIKTIRVELVEPGKGGGPEPKFKGATITGMVVLGGIPQAGVPVTLSDDKGALKAAAKTDAKGEYRFERVPPGPYVVNALQSSSRTRGRTLTSVPEGKEKVENVDVKLVR